MDTTERHEFPLLAAGQAQKELWHNEAIALLDLLVGGTIEGAPTGSPPATPVEGSLYLVAAGASGEWAGHGGQLAGHLASGWRFLTPSEGLCLTERQTGLAWRRGADGWVSQLNGSELAIQGTKVVGSRGAAIATPGGGTTIDVEARACLSLILGALRTHGLIQT